MEVSIINSKGNLERKSLDSILNWDEIELLTAIDPDDKDKLVLKNTQLPLKVVDLDGRQCYIVHHSLYFYDEIQQAKSPTSQGRYIARSEDKSNGWLLQYLPPFSHTSKHYHGLKKEKYHGLEGECSLEIDGKKVKLKGNVVTVQPGQIHQVKTTQQFALTLLIIQGDPKGLSMDDHNYI